MKPRDKSAKGLELILQSIVEYLEEHPEGARNSQISCELGLQVDSQKFTRVLSRELLRLLEQEQRVYSKGKPRAKLFFVRQKE